MFYSLEQELELQKSCVSAAWEWIPLHTNTFFWRSLEPPQGFVAKQIITQLLLQFQSTVKRKNYIFLYTLARAQEFLAKKPWEVHLITSLAKEQKLRAAKHKASPGAPRGAPYDGLYGEAPPNRGTLFRLQAYEREGISLVEVYKRVGKYVIWVCKTAQKG